MVVGSLAVRIPAPLYDIPLVSQHQQAVPPARTGLELMTAKAHPHVDFDPSAACDRVCIDINPKGITIDDFPRIIRNYLILGSRIPTLSYYKGGEQLTGPGSDLFGRLTLNNCFFTSCRTLVPPKNITNMSSMASRSIVAY